MKKLEITLFAAAFRYSPYPLGYYAIGEKKVYTLKQAYDCGVIDLNEVAGFAPTAPANETE